MNHIRPYQIWAIQPHFVGDGLVSFGSKPVICSQVQVPKCGQAGQRRCQRLGCRRAARVVVSAGAAEVEVRQGRGPRQTKQGIGQRLDACRLELTVVSEGELLELCQHP